VFDIFLKHHGIQTRWASFENPTGEKGAAATRNRGGKGYPCDVVKPGETRTLADIKGPGIITRIWMTVQNRAPRALRELRIDMYWDGAKTPAVSAPLGDFFGFGLARAVVCESALFASPEGRSFNSYVPMPFRSRARITLSNESADTPALLFYDVDYLLAESLPDEALYFHATWRRERPTTLCRDFGILPRVSGAGRFMGCCVGVITDPVYEDSWWGEGEVKVYLDGDGEHPTLCGTGTEDYIGTGWGQRVYAQTYHGCTVAEPETRQWAFYRLHVPDPVVFGGDCRVTLQQIGGCSKEKAIRLLREGKAPLVPVTVGAEGGGYVRLLEEDPPAPVERRGLPDGWTNFYRREDVSACAYFYLDRPENGLAPLAPVAERTAGTEVVAAQVKAGGVEA
jgi:hypothetical protein